MVSNKYGLSNEYKRGVDEDHHPTTTMQMRQVEHSRRFGRCDWGMASQLTLLLKSYDVVEVFREEEESGRSNGGGGQFLMMTFKPELMVTLGFMCLECSRTFYAVTRRNWTALTNPRKAIYNSENATIV